MFQVIFFQFKLNLIGFNIHSLPPSPCKEDNEEDQNHLQNQISAPSSKRLKYEAEKTTTQSFLNGSS